MEKRFTKILIFYLFIFCELAATPSVTVKHYRRDQLKNHPDLAWIDTRRAGAYISTLSFTDFPKNKYILMSLDRLITPDNRFEYQLYFRILENGKVEIKEGVTDPWLLISSYGFLPGEQSKLKFEAQDGSFFHEILFVHYPLKIASSDESLTLEAHLCSINPTVYGLFIRGLKPGDTYYYEATCGSTRVSRNKTFKDKQVILFSPKEQGMRGGMVHVKVQAPSKPALELVFPWGELLNQYL